MKKLIELCHKITTKIKEFEYNISYTDKQWIILFPLTDSIKWHKMTIVKYQKGILIQIKKSLILFIIKIWEDISEELNHLYHGKFCQFFKKYNRTIDQRNEYDYYGQKIELILKEVIQHEKLLLQSILKIKNIYFKHRN